MKIMKKLFLGTFLALTGCSLLGPVNTPQDNNYVLNTLPEHLPVMRTHRATILISLPETTQVYNTTSMAYTNKLYQIAFYSQNQWAETPSQMLLPLIAKSMEKTHYFRTVVIAPYIGNYDYVLNTRIIKIQQNYISGNSTFDLTIQVQLNRSTTGRAIASREFSIRIPIQKPGPYNGVIAANQAVAILLREIALFTIGAA